MESLKENILLPKFYDYLEVVIYNGPPNTIYGKYYERVVSGDEYSILAALKKCYCTRLLFKNIVNPSDNVILFYLKEEFRLLKDIKLDRKLSKYLIYQSVLINSSNFKDYKSTFNESEIIELLKEGADIYRNIDDLTLKMSKLVMLNNRYIKDLTYFKYWDNELIDMIINDRDIVSNLNIIPNLSLYQIEKAIRIHPFRLKSFMDITFSQDLYIELYDQEYKCIEYIPHDFQTDHMHKDIRTNHLEFVRFLRDKNQEDFEKLISIRIRYIKYVPEEFQTLEMCRMCVEYDKSLLEYCYCIDKEMLMYIFKAEYNKQIPKKNRFNFIQYFNEDALIRILKIKSDLLCILSINKQTDRLIKEVLQSDGYALQHIINPTKEHIEIALFQQPKAIKYVK